MALINAAERYLVLDKIEDDLIEGIQDAIIRDIRNHDAHERIKNLARVYHDIKIARNI